MEKVNATVLNVIMVIIATYMFVVNHFIEGSFLRGIITGAGVAAIAVISVLVIKSADINERRYYIFGTQKKDIIVSAAEFIFIFGLMTYLGATGTITPQVSAWETVLLIAFFMILFYGVEKKRLRNDIIREIEEEQMEEMKAQQKEETSEKEK